MAIEREQELNEALVNIASSLDIAPAKYQQAVTRYRHVGEWIEDGDYDCQGKPEIGPQGSFRLGTVVRPLKDGKEAAYDIDLVSKMPMDIAVTAAETLKNSVGDRLKENAEFRRLLDKEGRRCWTLEYAEQDGVGFHIDVLPGVADGEQFRRLMTIGTPAEYAQHALAIAEKNRDTDIYFWKSGGTNPKGYAEWFDDVNRPAFRRIAASQKRLLFESERAIYCSIDDVPDAMVRSPLQRAIQILKRHRDVRFIAHRWERYKPISIILTTLAARAYMQEGDVYTALRNIVSRLEGYARLLSKNAIITEDLADSIQRRDGRWWIPNPVNSGENFADRWNEDGSNWAEAFFLWISWVNADLNKALGLSSLRERNAFLEPVFIRPANPAPAAARSYPAVAITNPGRPWGNHGG